MLAAVVAELLAVERQVLVGLAAVEMLEFQQEAAEVTVSLILAVVVVVVPVRQQLKLADPAAAALSLSNT
jgi:hypothetical protein